MPFDIIAGRLVNRRLLLHIGAGSGVFASVFAGFGGGDLRHWLLVLVGITAVALIALLVLRRGSSHA